MADTDWLSDAQIDDALASLPGWGREGWAIAATYTLTSFPTAIELVRLVAVAAEAANHHPDIDIRWRAVTFRLSSHDAGGVTTRDIDLAHRIHEHATALGLADVEPPA